MKIGLTGGIGSGKSLCADIFEWLGIPVYRSDAEAKRLMESDPVLIAEISELFGPDSYLDSGGLNRKFLAQMIFADKEMLKKMNERVHPAVRRDFTTWTKKYSAAPYVLQESAILFETGLYHSFDRIILVDAPEEIRISRVMSRDNTTRQETKRRMENQWDSARKRMLADYIIDNDNEGSLFRQILLIHRGLLNLL